MEVKGTAVRTMPMFIADRFGSEGLKGWLDALSPQARKTYGGPLLASTWYPLKETLVEPTRAMCDMFFSGSVGGARAAGAYSAAHALSGIYKVFIKMGSVAFLIRKASTIMPKYYRPSTMEVADMQKRSAVVRITEFPDLDETVEARICGWIEKALEINGCRNVRIDITKSLLRGDPGSELSMTWV